MGRYGLGRALSLTRLRLPEHEVRRAVMAAAVFNFIGIPLGFVAERTVPGLELWPGCLSMAVGGFLFALLAGGRLKGNVRVVKSLFVVNAAFVSFALWRWNAHYKGEGVVPFQAVKLGTLVAAMLAPGIFSGIAAVSVHTGAGVVQYLSYPPTVRAALNGDEPWAILAFGLAACFVLVNRLRARQTELEIARVESRQRLADALLEIRDLMNTPVQSIELAAALLRKCPPEGTGKIGQQEILDRLLESCNRLKDLNLALKQRFVNWETEAPNRLFER